MQEIFNNISHQHLSFSKIILFFQSDMMNYESWIRKRDFLLVEMDI